MAYCVVLFEPENPDNIGAVARAMKNMGARDLRLINPPEDWLERGRKMAVGAWPLLKKARVYKNLKEALSDTCFVLGTTRRQGSRRRAFLEFPEAMERIRSLAGRKKAAVVFGKESKGLPNEALRLCDWFTTIPTDPAFPSINLAQAVMIICSVLYRGKARAAAGYEGQVFVSKLEFENVMEQVNEAVRHLEYKSDIASRIDHTFRDMLKRGGLLHSEGQMLKGLSRRIRERAVPRWPGGKGRRQRTRKRPE